MAKLLKNLYNQKYIDLLCLTIVKSKPIFNTKNFKKALFCEDFEKKELKERIYFIATLLGKFLHDNYAQNIETLKKTFSKMNHQYALENMIFQEFVAIYGRNNFELSMQALEYFTIGSSSEFAIRSFLINEPAKTLLQMRRWALHDNYHVRRLASEGCRPRLPWAVALPAFKQDPSAVLEILELLKDDESAYVRKSVANNLNDISKEHPDIVKNIAKKWIGFSKDRDKLIKHGCRTLLKNSDTEILELFGFYTPQEIKVTHFHINTEVKLGENLEFSFEITDKTSLGKIRVEYALFFLRKNGTHNKKVFKISEADIQANTKHITKSYSFKPISTRAYYKGVQKISIIINGVVFEMREFILKA